MTISIKLRPPYSIIFIEDQDSADVPEFDPDSLVSYNKSSILVGCACEADADTNIIFGWKHEVDNGTEPVFEHYISTKSKIIAIRTAEQEIITQKKLQTTKTKIVIWANDPSEPDEIRIGIVKE